MVTYSFIEHTADIGIRVSAKDLKQLFIDTAIAMFEIIAERKQKSEVKSQKSELIVKQKAEDLEELFVNWLNELLSLSATKGLIFSDFQICKLDKNNLEATILGEDINNYKVNAEIKAATYHQLKIEQKDSGWLAEVIFDV